MHFERNEAPRVCVSRVSPLIRLDTLDFGRSKAFRDNQSPLYGEMFYMQPRTNIEERKFLEDFFQP